jgi:hypothetical protein
MEVLTARNIIFKKNCLVGVLRLAVSQYFVTGTTIYFSFFFTIETNTIGGMMNINESTITNQ